MVRYSVASFTQRHSGNLSAPQMMSQICQILCVNTSCSCSASETLLLSTDAYSTHRFFCVQSIGLKE
ncbi:unnamed protein product [Pleuronectes platessa]|uniref:Uncharacterized protein n=1 Tax=Pleuronectes platessa TaxID=8262 RepID=A0A9N7TS65_PLEPL|nr:unnamed protein product [Pleuronectes platessa]